MNPTEQKASQRTPFRFFATRTGIITAGALIGLIACLLALAGNPVNMGICVACFIRDIAGSLGLHRAALVQYLRPEIPAFVLGSFLAALTFGEFKARGGSSPIIRFVLGAFAMIGALVFLGCPWRAILRLAGGDLNAITGIAGLAAGIGIGVLFLKNGYSLGRSHALKKSAGLGSPCHHDRTAGRCPCKTCVSFFQRSGPRQHARCYDDIHRRRAGDRVGCTAQPLLYHGSLPRLVSDARLAPHERHYCFFCRRPCIQHQQRNFYRRLCRSKRIPQSSPVERARHGAGGLAFALGGGCPGRQVFLSGEGDSDAFIFFAGMLTGAALAHNFLLASAPDVLKDGAL